MSEPVIRACRLGKRYRIAALQKSYSTLRDAVAEAARHSARAVRSLFNQNGSPMIESESIWALKDVSFEIPRGEAVGIIGRNGAGKSTLLKILSRITEPTEGTAELDGRVGSLLEVGTGFHQELSGRENIYLNGAILGMKRREIARRFDEIVAFAEVEKFVDTPVKYYSSGMYLRLAFAVAAHLEPDILIVDEVLAVGDAEFQKKCLGKMQDVRRTQERTVLFVSHNMNAIQRLCTRCVMLDGGRVVAEGATQAVIAKYLASGASSTAPGEWIELSGAHRVGAGQARFAGALFTSGNEAAAFHAYPDGPFDIALSVFSDAARRVGSIGVCVSDRHGTRLVNADSILLGRALALEPGPNEIRLRIERLHLLPGTYVVALWLADPAGRALDHIESAFEMEVVDLEARRLGVRDEGHGAVTCDFDVWVAGRASTARPG